VNQVNQVTEDLGSIHRVCMESGCGEVRSDERPVDHRSANGRQNVLCVVDDPAVRGLYPSEGGIGVRFRVVKTCNRSDFDCITELAAAA
jgi:hypothetical protein